MLSVIHVVSVVDVIHIDIISSVPDRRPGFRAGINYTKPEAPELETRGTFDHHNWYVVDPKPVSTAKMCPKMILWNAIPVVAATFVPGPMFMLPVVCALALPDVLPDVVRFRLGSSYFVQLSYSMSVVLRPLN